MNALADVELLRYRRLEEIAEAMAKIVANIAEVDECGDGFTIEFDMTHKCAEADLVFECRALTNNYQALKNAGH